MIREAFQGVSINVIYCLQTCQICKTPQFFQKKNLQMKLGLYTGCHAKKKKKILSLLWNTGHEGNKTSGNKIWTLVCCGANSALGTLAQPHLPSAPCQALTLTLSLWNSPSGLWIASITKSGIGLVIITVNENQTPLNVLLRWMCFKP